MTLLDQPLPRWKDLRNSKVCILIPSVEGFEGPKGLGGKSTIFAEVEGQRFQVKFWECKGEFQAPAFVCPLCKSKVLD